jgi:hypothetical protein
MPGQPTPAETLEHLRNEAKRRLKAVRRGDEGAMHWYRNAVPNPSSSPTLRDMQLAVARNLDFPGWADLKRSLETPPPDPQSLEGIVSRFLDNACPDHHVRGQQDHRRAKATAMRLLQQHPEIGPVNPVPELQQAKVGPGEFSLATDGYAGYPFGGRGELKTLEQSFERRWMGSDHLQNT